MTTYFILRWLLRHSSNKNKIIGIYKYLVYCFLLVEMGLRVTGLYTTYFEKKSGKYESIYKFRPQTALHKRPINDSFWIQSQDEYHFQYFTNNWGYSDKEWDDKESEDFKVLALGDSFTEGVGAAQDSSWVAQIAQLENQKNIKWYNAGISASDPFSNFYALENELGKLNPDLIIQVYTNRDFEEDILLRGGYERFKDGKLIYPRSPSIEILYAYSHIFRMIHHFGIERGFFVSSSHLKKLNLQTSFRDLVDLYSAWAIRHQTHVILLFFHTDSYYYSLSDKTFSLDIGDRKMNDYLSIKSISDCYKKEAEKMGLDFNQLWWSNDGHHNAKGYKMMAECIDDVIKPILDSLYQTK
ncbi:MAG: hypothetical protein M9887_11475 [Chitinophagales bacterium]|nr:hypothetical protein [Chitinophagales bacterium]